MQSPTTILQADYKSLPISPSFKRFFTLHSIANLESLLQVPTKDLLKMQGFNERTLKELVEVLDENGILDKLGD